uniref:RRM domain-containing protein n=1 Tax=Strombidinopsis acuminata TaxID=141414 RepID=A0A7S3SLD3_9SPIT|mmetsp:Transcript_43521/g.112423  ORF Transcript_43521/g.112423 Transcript_43521/m.112423 type:complete len:114 (+) Transcript_43521:95-436(+)
MGYGGKGKGKWRWQPPRIEPSLKIWIGNLPASATWKELQTLGNTAGTTKWVEVFKGKGAGTGMIAYTTVEEVAAAITALNGQEIDGQKIEADVWVKAEKPAEDEPAAEKAAES